MHRLTFTYLALTLSAEWPNIILTGHLEQIFNILDEYDFDLGVLHSTVDIEDCLKSMQASESATRKKRKVLLASAIADSSVTIPNVGIVIDTCRSLEVRWIPKRSRNTAATVYASRAICDQRKGRTGRTCRGAHRKYDRCDVQDEEAGHSKTGRR